MKNTNNTVENNSDIMMEDSNMRKEIARKKDSIELTENKFVGLTKQLLEFGYTIDEIHSIVDESFGDADLFIQWFL